MINLMKEFGILLGWLGEFDFYFCGGFSDENMTIFVVIATSYESAIEAARGRLYMSDPDAKLVIVGALRDFAGNIVESGQTTTLIWRDELEDDQLEDGYL